MPVIEALYTQRQITCKNSFHEQPKLTNGYYEFSAEETQFRFWKFLSSPEKSKIMQRYFDEGKCLLCSIDEELLK